MKEIDFFELICWLGMFFIIILFLGRAFSFLPLWANLIIAGTGIVLLILDIYDYLFKKE